MEEPNYKDLYFALLTKYNQLKEALREEKLRSEFERHEHCTYEEWVNRML